MIACAAWVGTFCTTRLLSNLRKITLTEQIFPFSLIFFTICAEKVYYKLCNACYKLSNTCYKLSNTCYKVCNKKFLVGKEKIIGRKEKISGSKLKLSRAKAGAVAGRHKKSAQPASGCADKRGGCFLLK